MKKKKQDNERKILKSQITYYYKKTVNKINFSQWYLSFASNLRNISLNNRKTGIEREYFIPNIWDNLNKE